MTRGTISNIGHVFEYDPDDYRRFEIDSTEEVGLSIVEAIATVRDVDPESIEPPLGTRIDLDALELLVENSGTDLFISFEVSGCEIVIVDEAILVTETNI